MKTDTLKNITAWAIIVTAILSAYLISFFENFNIYFLLLLIFELVLAIRFRKIFSPGMIRVSQVILGCLFLYSGFVKGVDPLGTAYRVEDYFIAFGTELLMPAKVFFSFILNSAELILGALLLFNIKPKHTAWLVLLMMTTFTIITLNDALNNPVPDCGCFGDVLILTNWQTFYKNLVINVFVLIVFLEKNRLKTIYTNKAEWAMGVGFIAIFVSFQFLNYINLPMMDFRAWKVGNKMITENPLPIKYYLTYQNKTTGEQKEYLSPDYPYSDPEWVANWEFVSQRVDDPNVVHGMDLAIINFGGEDVTKPYLENPDYNFFVVAWDLEKTNTNAFVKINELYEQANQNDLSMIFLTSTLSEQIEDFVEQENLSPDMEFFNADDIVLKTMIRSNPGLILMKNGQVIEKWHHYHLPDWEEVEEVMKEER